MRKAAVIGSPISHSLSPSIFRFVAARLALRGFRYSKAEVKASELSAFARGLREDRDYLGVNVTLPLKSAIFPELDEISPEARAMGAVNAVRSRDGKLSGFNTDVLGILSTLEDRRYPGRGGDCLVWGAGGAARAVAFALGKLGAARVFVFNPRSASARELVSRFAPLFPRTRFQSLEAFAALPADASFSLIVNTTPVGMKGVDAASDGRPPELFFAELARLPRGRGCLAFDLIYNPERTAFLRIAESSGMECVGGLPMLIDQALATFDLWADSLGVPELSSRPDEEREELRRELSGYLRKLLENREAGAPVFLTGFMGSGKSAVGLRLAHRLGRELIDLDEAIEDEAGMSVSELFASKGEAAFRKLEKAHLEKACRSRNSVVSLGGGALLDADSLERARKAGTIVYLEASPSVLEERLAAEAEQRPLLAGLKSQDRIRRIQAMLEQRRSHYERAQIRVQTDGKGPEEVAREIQSRLDRGGG